MEQSPLQRSKTWCREHFATCTQHCQSNRHLYLGVGVIVIIYCVLLLFNDQVVDPALEGLDSVGVQRDNPAHAIYFLLCIIVLFLPHPIMVMTIYWAVVGYFFKMFPGMLLLFFGNIIGVFETFAIGRHFRNHGVRTCGCCFNPDDESFQRFRAAVDRNPRKLIFMFQFWILPQQYTLLMAPVFTDVPLEVIFFPSFTGAMVCSIPGFLLGNLGEDLASSLDINDNNADVIALITLFTLFAIGIWIYSTITLQRAMTNILFDDDFNPLAADVEENEIYDTMAVNNTPSASKNVNEAPSGLSVDSEMLSIEHWGVQGEDV